jgi:pilus assembly protein CpaE
MSDQSISAAVISTDASFRAVFEPNGNGNGNGEGEKLLDVQFEILVPFVEISHGHLEELRYVDPEVVFIDLEHDPELGCKLAQFLVEANPSRRLIGTGGRASPEFLMTVMQAGVSEYLPKPVSPDALTAAMGRIKRKLASTGAKPGAPPVHRQPGRIYAFFAAKGGAGSTTLATNVAIQLHRLTGKKTVLVDLDLELGEIALFMGIEPRFNFVDLARNFHRMDEGLLASFIEAHSTGVHVLSAPNQPDKAEAVTSDQIRQILQFLKQHYDHIVIDTSNSLTSRTLATFEHADEIYLVTNVDLASLRNVQRCQHILERMNDRGDRVRLIVNRYSPEEDITLDDVERALSLEVYWTLPNDYEAISYSINTGQPVILNDCLYAHELEALGAKITGLPGAVSPRRTGGIARRLVDRVKSLLGTDRTEGETLMLPPPVMGGNNA